jgi:hypothetical protein
MRHKRDNMGGTASQSLVPCRDGAFSIGFEPVVLNLWF